MTLFHGSPIRDFTPTYGLGRDDHDYGRGFYTTADRELAREWAVGQQGVIRAYDEVYLSQMVEEQGKFFERMQDIVPAIDSVAMMTAYMHSSVRKQMDEGQAWYLTLDADHIKQVFLEQYTPKLGEPLRGFMPAWIGRFYAYAQWYLNIPSAQLCEQLPVVELALRYPGAHDQSLAVAVEKLCVAAASSH